MGGYMYQLAVGVNLFLDIYFWIIIVRIFLTWFPNINWENPILKTMAAMSDLILNPLRKIIPSVSGIDISPIITLILFQVVQQLIVRLILAFA